MTRWLSSVLPAVFVLAVALVLTGCGGGGSEDILERRLNRRVA